MIYKTQEGIEYDLDLFNDKEKELFDWLMREYNDARSWPAFQQRTGPGIISEAKKLYDGKWSNCALYRIQNDLVGNAGVRSGELKGTLSDMLVEKD